MFLLFLLFFFFLHLLNPVVSGRGVAVYASLLNFKKKQIADLSFTMGVLINISPNNLDKAYETLYLTSKKYLLLCEYYNPTPVAIDYRGHSNKLFKRDFAGELLNKYQDLELLEYGFSYKNDKKYSLDDINWFLLEKK